MRGIVYINHVKNKQASLFTYQFKTFFSNCYLVSNVQDHRDTYKLNFAQARRAR